MAVMSQLSSLALDYLLGDRTVWATDEELNATVRELGEKLNALVDAPDVKIWTRKLSTGVETYRMVPVVELDAYLAGIEADPDREVVEHAC